MKDEYDLVSTVVYRVGVVAEDETMLSYLEDMRNDIGALTEAAERIAAALEKVTPPDQKNDTDDA